MTDEIIYLDHAAATPLRREVLETLREAQETLFGNASSIHTAGQQAKRMLEDSREQVAASIGADPVEIVFTSGGTESDNLALRGTARALRRKGDHIITSSIEHHAVLNCCKSLESEGFRLSYIPVDPSGVLNVQSLLRELRPETILISVMLANNETGTLQPVSEIGKIARERGIVIHTDAVQAVGKIPVDVNDLGVDLLSLSAHKVYGPKGVGALYIRKGTPIEPILFGGHHERGMRPGTENVPGIAAFAAALRLATEELEETRCRLRKLRDRLWTGISERIDLVRRNGSPERTLPNILNVSFDGIEGESLLLNLDLLGIAVSTGSACTSGSTEPSHVLLAMGIPPRTAEGGIRFSLGRDNTESQIDKVLEVLPEVVNRLRQVSGVKL